MTLTESMFENLNAPADEAAPVVTQAEVQPAPEPAPEIPEQPAPEVQPVPEVVAEPVIEAPKPEHQTVPLSVLMAQRDEMQQIKRRNQELEARQNAQPQAREIPDPIDDPNGFAAHLRAEAQGMLVAQRFEMSKEIATQQHGSETVEAARQWAMDRASKDPAFDMALGNQAHPLGWIVQQHKRETDFAALGSKSLEDWFREEATKRGLVPPAPAAVAASAAALGQPAPAVVAQPPRSLANAPGSGGGVADVPTGPMSALGAVFK